MRSTSARALAASGLCVLFAALFACSSSSRTSTTTTPAPDTSTAKALRVTDISLGRMLEADKTIADKTSSFKPADTIYVSIKTEGAAPAATLKARWTYQDGQVVDESNQSIAPTGDAVSEFHVSKPDGWPAGKYKVEVLLDGASAGTKEFDVS